MALQKEGQILWEHGQNWYLTSQPHTINYVEQLLVHYKRPLVHYTTEQWHMQPCV